MADETRRDILAAAMDKMEVPAPSAPVTPEPAMAEPAPADTTSTPPAQDSGAPSSASPDRPRDDLGRFAPKADDAKPPAQAKAAAPPPPPTPKAGGQGPGDGAKPAGPATPSPAPARAAPELKVPSSYKPAAREAWGKVPPEVQAEIVRVDREVRETMQRTAEVRKEADEFKKAAAPWESMYRSLGVTPSQAFDGLSRAFYTLQYAPPQNKAQALAKIIRDAGLADEAGINLLAQAIDGKGQSAPAVVDPNAIAQQAEARILQRLQAQAAQQASARNSAMLGKFAEKHEFFEDVRVPMADILAARGTPNPSEAELEEVYTLACKTRPEIAGVLAQREAKKSAEAQTEANRRAENAASSVKPNPAGAAPAGQPKGRRAVLEAAWSDKIRNR